jgi:hypothetical protein
MVHASAFQLQHRQCWNAFYMVSQKCWRSNSYCLLQCQLILRACISFPSFTFSLTRSFTSIGITSQISYLLASIYLRFCFFRDSG